MVCVCVVCVCLCVVCVCVCVCVWCVCVCVWCVCVCGVCVYGVYVCVCFCCVLAALCILQAMRMRHAVIFDLPGSTIFFHVSSQRHDFSGWGVTEREICILSTADATVERICEGKSDRTQ
jgi:hypothetical protein